MGLAKALGHLLTRFSLELWARPLIHNRTFPPPPSPFASPLGSKFLSTKNPISFVMFFPVTHTSTSPSLSASLGQRKGTGSAESSLFPLPSFLWIPNSLATLPPPFFYFCHPLVTLLLVCPKSISNSVPQTEFTLLTKPFLPPSSVSPWMISLPLSHFIQKHFKTLFSPATPVFSPSPLSLNPVSFILLNLFLSSPTATGLIQVVTFSCLDYCQECFLMDLAFPLVLFCYSPFSTRREGCLSKM